MLLVRRSIAIVSHYANAFATKLEKIIADDLLLSVALLFLPIIYMLAALSLITGIGFGRWVLPAGLLLWATAVVALHRDKEWQKIATQLLLFLAAFALIALATSQLLDKGYDSRVYHYLAVQALMDGANPFYEPLKWVTFAYPAAHWLLSSSLILWTNSIEASCALTAPAILTAFICAWRFIATLTEINRAWRIRLAFLLATNPIAIWALFDHYVDGMLASTLLSYFMLMLAFVANGKNSKQKDKNAKSVSTRRQYVYITASLILLINIKFTGLLFGAMLGLTALAYGLAVDGNTKQTRKRLLQFVKLGIIAPILAIIFFGFFPYATNTIEHKNPFHSTNIYDEQGNKVGDVFNSLYAPEFYEKSNYERWWISLFSRQGKAWNKPAPLPPFSSTHPFSFELGFGSIFSGAMLLCLTLVLFIRSKSAWIVISGVLASIFITAVGHSFRLAPQNWWIPILILVFFLAKDGKDKNKSTPIPKKTPIPQNMPIPRAANIVAIVIVTCLLYSSISSFENHTRERIKTTHRVAELRKQGGWYVAVDKDMPEGVDFFRYYASGMTAVSLPMLKECPEGAQKKLMLYGLLLCKP